MIYAYINASCTESAETSWLTEGTMSGYLSKNAPGEGSTKELTPEEQATVQVWSCRVWTLYMSCDPTPQRRLLLGIGFTVAAAAFALVPTEELRGRPTQPLFFYLVPVLRSRQLLEQALELEEGDTTGTTRWLRLNTQQRSRAQGCRQRPGQCWGRPTT